MQATIPSANRFAPDGVCTAAALHAIVDNATFSGVSGADFSLTERPIYKDNTAPTAPVSGQLWFTTSYTGDSANPVGVLSVFDGTNWRPLAEGLYARNHDYSISISAGDVVLYANNENGTEAQVSVDTLGPAITGDTRVIGVAAQNIAPRDFGIIITNGLAYMAYLDSGSVVFGAVKMDSSASPRGAKGGSTAVTTGCFARVMDVTEKIVYVTGMQKVT